MVSCQLSVVSYQWSVISGQLSVVSGQLSVVSCQWSVIRIIRPIRRFTIFIVNVLYFLLDSSDKNQSMLSQNFGLMLDNFCLYHIPRLRVKICMMGSEANSTM